MKATQPTDTPDAIGDLFRDFEHTISGAVFVREYKLYPFREQL